MPTGIPVKVIDASALAAIIFAEPESESVAVNLAGAMLVAPNLLSYEMANICLKKMRKHPDQRDFYAEEFAAFMRYDVELVDVEHGEVLQLAASSNLTSYDASYLWLAQSLGAELITLDRRLAAAALTLR